MANGWFDCKMCWIYHAVLFRVLSAHGLNHGSPTCGPPGSIMPPTPTLVNCVYTIKITQQFRRLNVPNAVGEPAQINGVALCHKSYFCNRDIILIVT